MPETYSYSPAFASGQYSTEAISFYVAFAKLQNGKGAPGIHLDGDYTVATPCGAPLPEHPFQEEGDRTATIVRQPFLQDLQKFKPLALGTRMPNDARFVLIGETNFEDLGGRLVKWTRVYATVPQSFDVLGDYIHSYPYVEERNPMKISTQPIPVTSRLLREFFLINDLSRYPILAADEFRLTRSSTGTYRRRGKAQWTEVGSLLVVTGQREIVAEDSKLMIYHWPIYERRTRLVPSPTVEFWGDEFNLTA